MSNFVALARQLLIESPHSTLVQILFAWHIAFAVHSQYKPQFLRGIVLQFWFGMGGGLLAVTVIIIITLKQTCMQQNTFNMKPT